MKNAKLDKEEKEILDSFEKGSFYSLSKKDLKKEIERLQLIAKNTFAKSRTINFRISERDLLRLKALAAQKGMPYQTLISTTIREKIEKS